LAAVALLVLAACSSGDYTSGPVPPRTTTSTVAPEVTVRGAVATISASARVATLRQSVSGIANVAFTPETEVVRANGAPAQFTDMRTGATIEVTGRPGAPETLVARRVVLL